MTALEVWFFVAKVLVSMAVGLLLALPAVSDEIPEDFLFNPSLPEGITGLDKLNNVWGEAVICENPEYKAEFPKGAADALTGHSHICTTDESEKEILIVQYVFYVHPVRTATYFVVRWRLVFAPGLFLEGLYWNPEIGTTKYFGYSNKDFGAADDGVIYEVQKDHPTYRNYSQTVQWLFGIHKQLLNERERLENISDK